MCIRDSYIDDFYAGHTSDIKRGALFREMQRYLESCLHLNAREMFEEALCDTSIQMTMSERKQFYDKHIRQMRLVLDEDEMGIRDRRASERRGGL